jgi:flagellar export protein FliJ
MRRSERLGAVQRIAEKRVDDAAKALSAARAKLEGQQLQHQQLCDYRTEYAGSLANRAMSAGQLIETRAFLARINDAIEQQGEQIDAAQKAFLDARHRWMALRGREQALGKVVERAQGEELQAGERAEQAASDERGNRRGGGE